MGEGNSVTGETTTRGYLRIASLLSERCAASLPERHAIGRWKHYVPCRPLSRKLPHPTSLGLTTSLRCGFRQTRADRVQAVSLHWGSRVDSRSGRILRQGARTLQSPFASRHSSARLRVRLHRPQFGSGGDTANQCSSRRCSQRGSRSRISGTRTPHRRGCPGA